MKIKLENGVELESNLRGEYKVTNREFDKLPEGVYVTENGKEVVIDGDKIINILTLVGSILRLILRFFGK